MKYIIDVPEEIAKISEEFLSKAGLLCEPYTEPDLNPLVDEAVETIENEVWEFAMRCLKMDGADFFKSFGHSIVDCLTELSYSEAKSKYEAWLKLKDEIRVGDEVTFEMAFGNGLDNNMKAVALDQAATGEEWCVLTENGCVETHDEEDLYKTGRHFLEVAELLKKMRGEKE